jgi:hypothetical protein
MELKIAESRFLDLVESERFAPKVIQCFIRHLVQEWLDANKYDTPDERLPLEKHIKDKFSKCGFEYEVWFNNNLCSKLMFRYKGDDFWIDVIPVDFYTGLAIDKTKQ